MERLFTEGTVKCGGWSKTSNLDWFFIWSAVCVEDTDFEQLIISLLNDTGTHNYTVKGQN